VSILDCEKLAVSEGEKFPQNLRVPVSAQKFALSTALSLQPINPTHVGETA
jgi:hypothetical protein